MRNAAPRGATATPASWLITSVTRIEVLGSRPCLVVRIGILQGPHASHRRRSSNRHAGKRLKKSACWWPRWRLHAMCAAMLDFVAAKHGIARVHDSYEALIADPDLDAISTTRCRWLLHGRWTLGSDYRWQARAVREAVDCQCRRGPRDRRTGRQVRPGREWRHFTTRYHPCAPRVEEIIASGELGKLERVEAHWCFWMPKFSDIRYNYSLAGGALMDLGCYAVRHARAAGSAVRPRKSCRRKAKLHGPQVDRAMTAQLRFAGGHTGRVHCSMWSTDLPRFTVKVVGDRGELRLNPLIPFQRFTVESTNGKRVENFPGQSTYAYQLDAFAAAVLRGEPVRTTPEEAIENMTVIDAIYRAAVSLLASAVSLTDPFSQFASRASASQRPMGKAIDSAQLAKCAGPRALTSWPDRRRRRVLAQLIGPFGPPWHRCWFELPDGFASRTEGPRASIPSERFGGLKALRVRVG